MKKLITFLLLSFAICCSSWAQSIAPITEQEAVERAWNIALEQNLRGEGWVSIENSNALLRENHWVVYLEPKPDEKGGIGIGEEVVVYLTLDGEFIKLGHSY